MTNFANNHTCDICNACRLVTDFDFRQALSEEVMNVIGGLASGEGDLLVRGVGSSSPVFEKASAGTVEVHGDYVVEDYDGKLPEASYWADPSLSYVAFEAIHHAFGGDHPQCEADANGGLILAHRFVCHSADISNVDCKELVAPGTAWKFGKDEYLVFSETSGVAAVTVGWLIRGLKAQLCLHDFYVGYLLDKLGAAWWKEWDEATRRRVRDVLTPLFVRVCSTCSELIDEYRNYIK